MEALKKYLSYIPEAVLLILSFSWLINLFNGDHVIFPLVIFSMMMILLLIWKNKFYALILSVLIGLGSCYMILAAISEYSEFPAGDPKGIKLLLTGCLIFMPLALIALFMPFKYFSKQK